MSSGVAVAAPTSTWLNELVLLGTGTSSQVPAINCVTGSESGCVTCHDAMRSGSPNRRRCTCAVVTGAPRNRPDARTTILIDCGKSFYESALNYFPSNDLRRIDAVLLTHAHADAILGLDDLRSWTMGCCIQEYVDVYLTEECMETVKYTFPYLINTKLATGGGDVGALRWHIIDATKPFTVGQHNVQVVPLRVEHGFVDGGARPLECLGFRIDTFSYISDCHHIPEPTLQRLVGSSVVVLDALKMSRHASHFSIPQAITCFLDLAERHAAAGLPPAALNLLTDITHRVEHHTTEAQLQALLGGMRDWLVERRGAALPRLWWREIWDDHLNEATQTLALDKPRAPGPAHPLVPPTTLAFDGMRIKFVRT